MSNNLTHLDRLYLRRQLSGESLGAGAMSRWMKQKNASYNFRDANPYKLGEGSYNSFKDMASDVYSNNPAATAYQHKVELGGDFQGKMKKLSSSGLGASLGNILSDFGSTYSKFEGDGFTESQRATQAMGRSLLNMIPAAGPAISLLTGALDLIGGTTGLNMSNLDPDAAEHFGVEDGAKINNIINSIPGASMLAGMFGERTNKFNKSIEIENLRPGYGGTFADIDAAEALSEKRVRKKDATVINEKMDSADAKQDLLLDIDNAATKSFKGLTNENIADNNKRRTNKYFGNSYSYMGKSGMKLLSIEEVNRILNSRKSANSVQEFKNGGVIGIDSSIIPEGKLHAHKHNLKDTNPDLEDVTKKGIPIVTLDEGGELQQVAEIEKEEIIFRKEVTNKLEALYNDGSEEAMIEAGKLIAEELMTNTDDNTEEFINEDSKN